MGSRGIAVTSMRSSAPCGVIPRRLGSAARLLGRVQLLLRLGSSEGSVFGMLSLVPLELFKRFGSLGVYASYVYPEGAPMLSSCLYALWDPFTVSLQPGYAVRLISV